MRPEIFVLTLLAGVALAGSLSYNYDADGRLVSSSKSADSSMFSPTSVHNLSEVMTFGDANTNGMPDSLEAYLAGCWGPDYNPMLCDSDGDGICDRNEWMLGTNPFSYDSCFAGWGGGMSGGGGPLEPYDYTIHWSSVPFKTYAVEFMWQLTDGEWISGATNLPATPPVNSWTHEDITNRHAFYRILAVIPPPSSSTNIVDEGGSE